MGIDKKKLLDELKISFEDLKKEKGFNSSYEELEKSLTLEDYVLSQGYVSTNLLDELVNKLSERFYSWVGVLHSLIMPPPSDLIYSSESKKLNKNDKEEIFNLIKGVMYLTRKTKRLLFERNSEELGLHLDELVDFDRTDFSPLMAKYHRKLEEAWKQKS
jgi:hypothetical protein|tara:strand:+ start:1704 stop:2183 length:480 start_codon:yes stop_codon:yes gene_type:complete